MQYVWVVSNEDDSTNVRAYKTEEAAQAYALTQENYFVDLVPLVDE